MPPRKLRGISPTDGISLVEFLNNSKPKRVECTAEDDWDGHDDGDDGDDDGFIGSSPRSDDSRFTLYKEPHGYIAPQDHREMELYIASIHRDREVVARIDHFIGPASKAKMVSLPGIEGLIEAVLSNHQ